jgi:transcriptional regulator with XRE-family HTH domain
VAETFGQRLQRLRQERRITVSELARAVGVSPSAIRQLESGASKSASLAVGLRIADVLEVEPRLLAFGDGSALSSTLRELQRRVALLENERSGLPPGLRPRTRR